MAWMISWQKKLDGVILPVYGRAEALLYMDIQITNIAESIACVPGVRAVALGGSRSRGEASSASDYDLGLYYMPGELDLAALAERIRRLDDEGQEGLLHPPGEWGPWINGGAWLTVGGTPVDMLLRDIRRVEEVLGDCVAGIITVDYQCGHPFGFVNTIYAAEVHYCRPLWQDASHALDGLKRLLEADGGYPDIMRQAVIGKFVWEAWFSLACARKSALGGETNYAMGSVFRAACAWAQVVYALNRQYLMNEKRALRRASEMNICPPGLETRVLEAYRLLAAGEGAQAFGILDLIQSDIERLAGRS